MNWNEVLIEVINLLFKVISLIAIPYLANLVSIKIENDRIKHLVAKGEEFVKKSVDMVQQTFVDSLKKEGKFDAEAQKIAFKMAYDNWVLMASDEIKEAVVGEVGNIDAWLNTMIEAGIKEMK